LSFPRSVRYNPWMVKRMTQNILEWYSKHKRDLPWRDQVDPYVIWISEVMLQQTRVETVISYYENWVRVFPNLKALAKADLDDVLNVWEGLGYYRRAHNLHRTARLVVEKYGGTLPQSMEELEKLPGIGSYTASAIVAFAHEGEVVALDGNLRRVLSRWFDYDQNPRTAAGEEYLVQQALGLMPQGAASSFNQALMDLGAMICLPNNPLCDRCPVSSDCLAHERGTEQDRPVSVKRKPIPHHRVSAGVLERDGKVLIGRRLEGELLGGLWEFPGGTCEEHEPLENCLVREWEEELDLQVRAGKAIGVFSHAYTHFRVTVHAFECLSSQGEPKLLEHQEIRWVRPEDLENFPMGKIDREISRTLLGNRSVEETSPG
jgi:A/G-specific adenine glycosylase